SKRTPSLADLAALEWARARAFIAADSPVVSTLEGVQPTDRLQLTASVQLVKRTLVWRKDFTVFHVEVSPAEAKALRRALEGKPFADIVEPFSDAETAFRTLASWVTEKLVARI